MEKFKRNPDRRPLLIDGIHLLDLMRWFCGGDYTEVSAMAAYERDAYHEQTVGALVRFSSGAIGSLLLHRNSGQWRERFTLHGSGVTAVVDWPETLSVLTESGTEVQHFKPADWAWASDFLVRGGFQQEVEAFVHCVRSRQPPLTDGEEAIASHRLVWKVYATCALPLA